MENEVDVTILPRTEDLVVWLVSLVPVIFLLLWDVWKAWKRRAFWIPGQALVLSALIIQLLSFIDYSHIRVYSGSRYQTKEVVAILVKNQLVIDSGRLMLCVLIAYLLPGMARSGSITDGSNLAALALSIIFHVVCSITDGSNLAALALSIIFHVVSELRGFHYIDNVLKGDALKKLLPQDMSRAKKVRLLLTARDENVKNACPRPCTEPKIYKMEGIQDQEALIILKKEIKDGINYNQFNDIIHKCGGIPLVLTLTTPFIGRPKNEEAYSTQVLQKDKWSTPLPTMLFPLIVKIHF